MKRELHWTWIVASFIVLGFGALMLMLTIVIIS